MFKLNQSLVEQMNLNKSVVVITNRDFLPAGQIVEEQEEKAALRDDDVRAEDHADALRMIEEAKTRAKEIEKSAWEQGYKDGKDEARQEAAAFMQAQANEARSIFTKLAKYKQELYRELQDSVLELSFDIAEKILNIEMERNDRIYVDIVKKAISELKSTDKFVIRMGRKEYDQYFKEGAQWLIGEMDTTDFEVVCDAQMGEGGCILESDEENVNASVKLQMSRVRHVLEDKAERHD